MPGGRETWLTLLGVGLAITIVDGDPGDLKLIVSYDAWGFVDCELVLRFEYSQQSSVYYPTFKYILRTCESSEIERNYFGCCLMNTSRASIDMAKAKISFEYRNREMSAYISAVRWAFQALLNHPHKYIDGI